MSRKLVLYIFFLLLIELEFSHVQCTGVGLFATEREFIDIDPDCEEDLRKILDGLEKQQFWALKILDASTKIPSGILTGHLSDFGNYDECLEENNVTDTQFCFANIRVPMDQPGSQNGSFVTMKWSYCIPKTCPPEFLEKTVTKLLSNLDFDVNVTVNSSDCATKQPKTLALEDYIGICIWGTFGLVVVFSTLYDGICRKSSAERSSVLASFSIYSNGKKLFSLKTSPDNIPQIHGLRFLSICWVLLGHRLFFTFFSSLINFTDFIKEVNKVHSQIFIQGVLAVDTFFLLSGLLNCYYLLKVLDTTKRFPIFMYYVHRYVRLTPVLAAIVLMYASWYVLIGDGPAWTQTTSEWKNLCLENWWPTLLYINNYYNPVKQCAGQSWYLAVDMQLYWLSPLLIIPLHKWPKCGKIGLWCLLMASCVSVFLIAYIYEFRASFNLGVTDFDEFLRTMKMIYVPTHTRATPYIIGVMLGFYVYDLRKSNRSLTMSKCTAAIGWLTSTLICLTVLFGNYQFTRPLEDHPYNRLESALYISLHRLGWGFGIGWIIFSCLNNSGGIINSILSWKGFVPLSRLTYCIFLSHMAIQQYNFGTARTSDYFQYFNQFHKFFGDVLSSLIVAAILNLVFESPVLALEKLILRKPNTQNLKFEINEGYEGEETGKSDVEKNL